MVVMRTVSPIPTRRAARPLSGDGPILPRSPLVRPIPGPGCRAQARRRDPPSARFANPIVAAQDAIDGRVDFLQAVGFAREQGADKVAVEPVRRLRRLLLLHEVIA